MLPYSNYILHHVPLFPIIYTCLWVAKAYSLFMLYLRNSRYIAKSHFMFWSLTVFSLYALLSQFQSIVLFV